MKTAIQFGAGNIGRGFIGAVLAQAGYRVIFADVNPELLALLDSEGAYTVRILDTHSEELRIEGVSAVDSRSEALRDLIADADIVTTAVGLNVLPRIAGALAAGIAVRAGRNEERPLNVIACENGIRASSQLEAAVIGHLDERGRAYCERCVGFPDCSVDRIVPPVRSDNPLDVIVEHYAEWIVDRNAFAGPVPDIPGMTPVANLQAYVERKLLTLNTGHAITAYLGRMYGYVTIDESIADPTIYRIVRGAMRESGRVLAVRFGFDRASHFAYIDRIIDRFRNPYLCDDVVRVGREPLRKLAAGDRLLKPAVTAREYAVATPDLLLGIGAALHYSNPADPEAVGMQEMIRREGLEKAVARITSLPQDDLLIGRIVYSYREIERIVEADSRVGKEVP